MTGCSNSGSCVYNAENQTYSCVCKASWSGDNCDYEPSQSLSFVFPCLLSNKRNQAGLIQKTGLCVSD